MLGVEDGDLVRGSERKRTMKSNIEFYTHYWGSLGISAVRPGFILCHLINPKKYFTSEYRDIQVVDAVPCTSNADCYSAAPSCYGHHHQLRNLSITSGFYALPLRHGHLEATIINHVGS
jgi:hypothetical protein